MKATVKEDCHFSLDGFTVFKYQIGNIVEAKTEIEIASLKALISEGLVEAIPDSKATKTTKDEE